MEPCCRGMRTENGWSWRGAVTLGSMNRAFYILVMIPLGLRSRAALRLISVICVRCCTFHGAWSSFLLLGVVS